MTRAGMDRPVGADLESLNPVREGLMRRLGQWRGSGYRNFVLDKAAVAAWPTQIDHVRLPLGYRARESLTDRTALTGMPTPSPLHAASPLILLGCPPAPLHFSPSGRSPVPKVYLFLPTGAAVRSRWTNITIMLQKD